MHRVSLLAIALMLVGGCQKNERVAGRVSATPEDAREAIAAIVADFRGMVVLLADEPAEDDQAIMVARLLFQRSHERADALVARIGPDPAVTGTILTAVEGGTELHDADKLALRDLLAELPADARVKDARRNLDEIQARYDKELTKLYEQLGMRAAPERREAWMDYVTFARTAVSRETLMSAFAGELASLDQGSRGKGAPWRDDSATIVGRRLPEKTVLLTFDDGPSARFTPVIRGILKKYGASGVFFEVGRNVKNAPAEAQTLQEGGFALGNHSFTHAFLPKLTEGPLDHQITDTNAALEAAAHSKPVLFRPPYGARNALVVKAAATLSMKTMLWNIDSMDWADPVPRSIARRVLKSLDKEKRGIVLFHDIHERTTQALPLVLDELTRQGYRFLAWNGKDLVIPPGEGTNGEAGGAGSATIASAPLYRESWALVVGINNYKSWPQLSYAVNDAKAIRELLIGKYGFDASHVTTLIDQDATRDRILAALGEGLSDGRRVAREDRVVVFFAGHGTTRKLPNGKNIGYIIPVDATVAGYQTQAISMTTLQDMSDAIPAKHAFFVMDACYSGLALTRGGAAGAVGDRRQYLQEITRRTARQVLTAGGADEQVADNGPGGHSIFTWTLLQGLEGKADLDGDSVITATELAAYVAPSVSSLSRQTPVFGHLAGSEGGELVFASKPEEEFLSEESRQLDGEAIRLNAELDRVRKEVEQKRARVEKLKGELVTATNALGTAAGPPPNGMAQAGGGGGAGTSAAATNALAGVAPPGGTALPPLAAPPTTPADEAKRQVERGMTLYREKRYEEAARAFQAALASDPNHVLATNNLGFAYYKLGRLGDAVTWYQKTLALDPRRAVAYANLGDAYADLHRPADARRAFEKFLELQPRSKIAPRVRQSLAALPAP